jgi:hypothetical protein
VIALIARLLGNRQSSGDCDPYRLCKGQASGLTTDVAETVKGA